MRAPEPTALDLTLQLRRAFDESFAAPLLPETPAGERFLSIHAGGEAWALPLAARSSRIAALSADRTIVPVRSRTSEFVGLVAVGGLLIPAFDLASLAGLGRGQLRWTVLLRLEASVALVFESLDGLFEASSSDLRPVALHEVRTPRQSLVTRLARRDERFLPVLDLDAIGDSIRRRAGSHQPGSGSGVLAGDPPRG